YPSLFCSDDISQRLPPVRLRTDGRQDDAAAAWRRGFGLDHVSIVFSVDAAAGLRLCARTGTGRKRTDSDSRPRRPDARGCVLYWQPVCDAYGRFCEHASDNVADRNADSLGRYSVLHRLNDGAVAAELAVEDIDCFRT